MFDHIFKKLFSIFFSIPIYNFIKDKQFEYFLINIYVNLFKHDTEVISYHEQFTVIKIFDKKLIVQFPQNTKKPLVFKSEQVTINYDGNLLYKIEKGSDIPVYLDINRLKINEDTIQIVFSFVYH